MEELVKRVIWIDKNVKNIENQMFLEILEGGIKNAIFYPVESIEEAFDLIKNKKGSIKLKNGKTKESKLFQFRLFYVIVSGSLSNDFFREYVKATKELAILSANIIFCENETKHRFNAYYLDDFLNPGRGYNEKSIDKIIEYINKDEAPYLNDYNLMESKLIYEPQKRNFGNVFFNVNQLSDIAYPFFFGKIINSTLINKYDLEGFQKFLLNYYPELKDLIIPSREKKIDIPYYLLAKFYLHMYTYEQCQFFKNMNLDLSNNKFDIYRIYIFLLYDALNKQSIKSCFKQNLYRGTVLSKKELEKIETLLKYNEEINENDVNICLYFSKMFLSFSKRIDVAKGYIYKGNEELVPVLFEVEGLNEKDMENNDFFVSNMDLENISEYNGEEEVLFLPFSCFEIISTKDEEIIINNDEKLKIKKIYLNYLYKYKSSLYKNIEKIKEKEKYENFLRQVINSEFSKEISELINFKDFDIGKQFHNFINQKFMLNQALLSNNFFSSYMINKICLNNEISILTRNIPQCCQKIVENNRESLLLNFSSGEKIIIYRSTNKIIYKYANPNSNFIRVGEPILLNNVKQDIIIKKNVDNTYNQNIKKEYNKKNIESKFLQFYSLGMGLGELIANYDSIKDEPLIIKLKSLGIIGFNNIIPFIPNLFSKFLPKAVLSKVPILMGSISAYDFILSVKDVVSDKSLTKSETAYFLLKQIVSAALNCGIQCIFYQLSFKLLMYIPLCPEIVIPIGAIGLGLLFNFGFSKLKKYFINKDEIRENLTFFSDSLYYQYIPKKFREYCIPTLSWNGVTNKVKSFTIELVEDGNRKWLIINIKKWIRKIHNDNYLDVGDTIVDYKGISKNPYKVTFILYELSKEQFSPEEWGVGDKDKIENNYSETLSKYFNQVATLDVF